MIGLTMVLLAVLVLAAVAVAVAASTRMGRVATLLICSGTFIFGLVGDYLLSLGGSQLSAPLSAVVPNIQLFWPADALTQGHTSFT